MKEVSQSTLVGRMAHAWYERTGNPIPRAGVLTTCHLRLIALYQWFWILRAGKVPGMRFVRWWMVISVGLFVFFCWAAPDFMRVLLLYIPFMLIATTVLGVVLGTIVYVFGSAIMAIGRSLHLEKVVAAFVDFLSALHEWLWNLRLDFTILGYHINFKLPWLLFTVGLALIEAWSYYAFLYSTWGILRAIGLTIFLLLAAVQAMLIAGGMLMLMLFFNEKYDLFDQAKYTFHRFRKSAGLISPQELAALEPNRDSKVYGIYKMLMDLGLCQYAKLVD